MGLVQATHGSRFFCRPFAAKNIATHGSLLRVVVIATTQKNRDPWVAPTGWGDCGLAKESRPMGRSYGVVGRLWSCERIATRGSLLRVVGRLWPRKRIATRGSLLRGGAIARFRPFGWDMPGGGSRFFCHPITANTAKNIATHGSLLQLRGERHRDPALANRKPERLSPHPVGATHGSRFFCHPFTAKKTSRPGVGKPQTRTVIAPPRRSDPRVAILLSSDHREHREKHRDPWVAPTGWGDNRSGLRFANARCRRTCRRGCGSRSSRVRVRRDRDRRRAWRHHPGGVQ